MIARAGVARQAAHVLVHFAARQLPPARAAWGDPMRLEVDSIESDLAALRWAAGCVVASISERIGPMRMMSLSPYIGVAALSLVVFGGYLISGGDLKVLLEAVPALSMTVVLGALAATAIASPGGPRIGRSIALALQGRRFRKDDYRSLAAVLMDALSTSAGGRRPAPVNDDATRMISDANALANQDCASADQIGFILQARIGHLVTGQKRAVRVLRMLARNFLWISAVAFILGTIKTLQEITHAPEEVGGMMAHAAVAPLLGIFLATGIVGPLANRLNAAIDDDTNFYELIRMAFFCKLAGNCPSLAVRTACGALPPELALDREDLESLRDAAAA